LNITHRFAQPFTDGAVRCAKGDGGKDAVATTRQQFEAFAGRGFVFGFGQDAAARGYDRVAGEYVAVTGCGSLRLFARHALCIVARQFALMGRFIDVRGIDGSRRQPEACEKFAPAGTGRC
tara:strand:+ start:154 stop:516 length:363 start_codon:yes stop_codon:yes gene_type:complete